LALKSGALDPISKSAAKLIDGTNAPPKRATAPSNPKQNRRFIVTKPSSLSSETKSTNKTIFRNATESVSTTDTMSIAKKIF
jgi:hypothetical protein